MKVWESRPAVERNGLVTEWYGGLSLLTLHYFGGIVLCRWLDTDVVELV